MYQDRHLQPEQQQQMHLQNPMYLKLQPEQQQPPLDPPKPGKKYGKVYKKYQKRGININ